MKIVELFIDWENEEVEDLGVDILSLVSQPAIGYQWQAFNEEVEIESMADKDKYKLELFESCGETMSVEDIYIEIPKEEFADISISDIAKSIGALDILGKRNADSEGVKKYQYAGPRSDNTRNFCRAMLNMNKLYSAEELVDVGERMKSRFPTLYPDDVKYDKKTGDFEGGVAQWMGGSRCQHHWNMVEVFSDGNGPKVVVAKGKAPGDMGKSMQQRFTNQWLFSEDQMIITGPAMVPEMYIPRKDEDGNVFYVFFSSDTVKKIARKFIAENKQNNTDINHDDNVVQENTLLESWIVEDPKLDKSTALGFDVPKDTWMVSMKINDQETWSKIKDGTLTGYSVAGNFAEKLGHDTGE